MCKEGGERAGLSKTWGGESKINDGAITIRQIRRLDNDTIDNKFPKPNT